MKGDVYIFIYIDLLHFSIKIKVNNHALFVFVQIQNGSENYIYYYEFAPGKID